MDVIYGRCCELDIHKKMEVACLLNPGTDGQPAKAMPGRKTDVKDAEWLAELLRHGLLRPSFVPDRAQRELQELTLLPHQAK